MLNILFVDSIAGVVVYQVFFIMGIVGSYSNQMLLNVMFINENDVQVSLNDLFGEVVFGKDVMNEF